MRETARSKRSPVLFGIHEQCKLGVSKAAMVRVADGGAEESAEAKPYQERRSIIVVEVLPVSQTFYSPYSNDGACKEYRRSP